MQSHLLRMTNAQIINGQPWKFQQPDQQIFLLKVIIIFVATWE